VAIARLSTGEIYADYADINEAIGPVQVGSFDLSDEVREKVRSLQMPLTADAARYIISNLGDDAREQMRERGYSYEVRRVGCFVPPTTPRVRRCHRQGHATRG
jgi:hypothetical protein